MRNYLLAVFLTTALQGYCQENLALAYYLPQNISYDDQIPTPKEVIGHEVGEWHITHDKLVMYMRVIAEKSERISLEDRGKTFEGRPLLLMTITSSDNHQNIAQIQEDHLALTENGGGSSKVEEMPIVVYQGFSIHGNEPSGSNAALAYAYYLAAAQGPEIEALLNETVILLDPSFNPDGLQRFAYWANTNRSLHLNPDPNDREFHEVWPGGRTNHYWFDMNRDWLPVQLPESRARIESFHSWMPNILTDHHEMGTDATFFFQPGVPQRVHPLTPKMNQTLTAEIGSYHAKALDEIGSLYYSEERFDDYYYGKGSTFPDVMGGIGILFEQASSRGHAQASDNGLLTFPFTIRNQFITALSTIEAAKAMRTKLLKYQQQFYKDAVLESVIGRSKGIIFGDHKDAARTWHLAEILKRHKIKVHQLARDITLNGKTFKKGYGFIVPKGQKNHRLIKAMFEKRTTFQDSLFYDVSAWTLPLAFNMDYTEVRSLNLAGPELDESTLANGSIGTQTDYAYLLEWNEYYAPKALHTILDKGLRAKVAKAPFKLEGKQYGYGTILIPVQNQVLDSKRMHGFLKQVAQKSRVCFISVETGLSQGIDLGSNDFKALAKQKVAILVGDGVRSNDAGEVWHLFDTRYEMPLTKIDLQYLPSIDISRYTDIIAPSLDDDALSKKEIGKLKAWVKAGGTLIGYRKSVNLFNKKGLIDIEFRKDTLVAKNVSFGQKSNFEGAQETGGAIFETRLDLSHPINYGYKNSTLPTKLPPQHVLNFLFK